MGAILTEKEGASGLMNRFRGGPKWTSARPAKQTASQTVLPEPNRPMVDLDFCAFSTGPRQTCATASRSRTYVITARQCPRVALSHLIQFQADVSGWPCAATIAGWPPAAAIRLRVYSCAGVLQFGGNGIRSASPSHRWQQISQVER